MKTDRAEILRALDASRATGYKPTTVGVVVIRNPRLGERIVESAVVVTATPLVWLFATLVNWRRRRRNR